MKKRHLLIGVVFFGLSGLLGGCELFEECGTCELVTIDADGNETRTTPLPFCGEELQNKKNSSPETIGGITSWWECY